MGFSASKTLAEVRAEIARLQKVEQALMEVESKADVTQHPRRTLSNVSDTGLAVIATNNRLTKAKRTKPVDKQLVSQLEKELSELRQRLAVEKKERHQARLRALRGMNI